MLINCWKCCDIIIGDGVVGDDEQLYVLTHRILRRASGI